MDGLERIVVRHAMLVVAAWIIISIVSAPFAARIDEVTEYRAERLMPNATESMEAARLISGVAGAVAAYDIVLIDNVNATDPGLIEWDEEFNESVRGVLEDYMSPYKVAREALMEAEPRLWNMSRGLVNASRMLIRVFDGIRGNYTLLVEMINRTHMLVMLYNETASMLQENYTLIDRAASMLSNNASMIIEGYIEIAGSLNQSYAALRETRGLASLVYAMLGAGDEYYSETLGVLDELYENMTMLNTTLVLMNNAYYNGSMLYTRLLYDAARIHYYLSTHTDCYDTGNLSENDVEAVINYTSAAGLPVEPREVENVFNTVIGVLRQGGAVNDTVLAWAANQTFAEYAAEQPYEQRMIMLWFNAYYSKSLLVYAEQALAGSGYTNLTQPLAAGLVEGQLLLLDILRDARLQALPEAVEYFAEDAAPVMASYMGVDEELVYMVLVDAYSLGENYTLSDLRSHVVEDMYRAANQTMGPLPTNATHTLLELLYTHGPQPMVALNATKVFLAEVFPAPPGLPDLVASNIWLHDPRGEGLIAGDEELRANLTGVKLHEYTGLPLNITMRIYNASDGELWLLAEILVENGLHQANVSDPAAYVMLRQAYLHNASVSREALVDALMAAAAAMAAPGTPFTLPRDLAEYIVDSVLRNETPSYTYVAEKLVLAAVSSMISSHAGGEELPVDPGILFNENTSTIRVIVEHRGRPPSGVLREAIVNDTLAAMEKAVSGTGGERPPISMEEMRMVVEELAPHPYPGTIDLYRELAERLIINISSTMIRGRGWGFAVNETVVAEAIHVLLETNSSAEAAEHVLLSMTPPGEGEEIPRDVYEEIIGAAVETGDAETVYAMLHDYVRGEIFSSIIEAFRGQMISPDNKSFIVLIQPLGDGEEEKYRRVMDARSIAEETLRRRGYAGARIYATGDDVLGYEAKHANARDIETINRVSMIAPLLIALALIGGVLATGLPFIGIGVAVLVSMAVAYILGYIGLIDVTSWSRMLAITTAFGLGVDYSSYIILRFKEEMGRGAGKEEASRVALKQSLPAILASSSTDIIGFAVMMLAWEFPLLASMGETIPIAIASVLLVSLTLTPAILALLGDKKWFWWPRGPHRRVVGEKILVTRRIAAALILLTGLLAAAGAMGLAGFKGSHDYSVFMPENTEGYKAYTLLQERFPAGQLMPIQIVGVVAGNHSVWDPVVMEEIRELADEIAGDPDVAAVYGPHNPGAKTNTSYVLSDNKTFYLEVILRPAPLSREGIEATKRIRGIAHSHRGGVFEKILVGGIPASSLEMEELLTRVFWTRIMPVGMVLMWLAMTLSFRSIWPGILALATIFVGYSAGVAASSAAAAAYGQPALWFLPLMTFPAVLGVGMDYNSFYMNRVREEMEKLAGKPGAGEKAASIAIRAVSLLVVGLGLVVTSTYAALILGSSWGIREIGIALSVGVFTITVLAAYAFTPAAMALMGEKAWWPLSRRWRNRGVRERD